MKTRPKDRPETLKSLVPHFVAGPAQSQAFSLPIFQIKHFRYYQRVFAFFLCKVCSALITN